jgi:hypothetical protein
MFLVRFLGNTISRARFQVFSTTIANEIIENKIMGQIITPPERRI